MQVFDGIILQLSCAMAAFGSAWRPVEDSNLSQPVSKTSDCKSDRPGRLVVKNFRLSVLTSSFTIGAINHSTAILLFAALAGAAAVFAFEFIATAMTISFHVHLL